MVGHIFPECWNVRYGHGITANTVTNASVNISNRFIVLKNLCNVCNCDRSVCQHTSLNCACLEIVCEDDKCENFDSAYNVSCLTYSPKINTTVVENRAKFKD